MKNEKGNSTTGRESEYWNEGLERGQSGKSSAEPFMLFDFFPPTDSEREARERGYEVGRTLNEIKKDK